MTTFQPPEPNNEPKGGPEDGHRFRFMMSSAGSAGVRGGPKKDADWWSDPWTVEVRAWSLADAIVKLYNLNFADWVPNHYLEPEEGTG